MLQNMASKPDSRESDFTPDEEKKETEHFQKVVDSFRYYRIHSLKRIALAEKHFNEIPSYHQRMVPSFQETIMNLQYAVDQNYLVIKQIIRSVDKMFENKLFPLDASIVNELPEVIPRDFDMDKVKTVLKQIVRDWSEAGAAEREACYNPVIRELVNIYTHDCISQSIRVLVPGAGLGRLAHEIARLGFTCQGNEWSFHMLCASHFVLNRCETVNQYKIYPWIHQYSNNPTREVQLESCSFPDISPTDLSAGSAFSMAAGDFLEVYTQQDSWNCVSTVFFIDTAHNVIEYMETIYHILVPGGYWINLGPLLYHYADVINEASIELSYNELREVITKIGFEFIKESKNHLASYTENPKSMLNYTYNCVLFVCRKPVAQH